MPLRLRVSDSQIRKSCPSLDFCHWPYSNVYLLIYFSYMLFRIISSFSPLCCFTDMFWNWETTSVAKTASLNRSPMTWRHLSQAAKVPSPTKRIGCINARMPCTTSNFHRRTLVVQVEKHLFSRVHCTSSSILRIIIITYLHRIRTWTSLTTNFTSNSS